MIEQKPNYYAVIPANVRYADVPPNAKLLYGEITALSNKEGFCYATNNYFAELYGVSKISIQRWIKKLVSFEFISVEFSSNNERKIYLKAISKTIPGHIKNDTALLIYNNTTNKEDIYKEKDKKESYEGIGLDNECLEVWKEFVKFRIEIKHPLTKTSTIAIVKKLKKYDKFTAIQMLQNSIENGWRGVFPIIEKKGKVKPIKVSNFDGQESGFVNAEF